MGHGPPAALDYTRVMSPFPADAFRDAFVAQLENEPDDPTLARFTKGLQASDFAEAPRRQQELPGEISALLNEGLDRLDCAPPLAEAIRTITQGVRFYPILAGAPVDPSLERGLIAGQVGFSDLAPSRLGFFLLEPGLDYPLHQHAAEEIYYVASGKISIQHHRAGRPNGLLAGDFSITPPHRLHALRTHDEPCLIVYAWIGDITAPGYWWEQAADRSWHRVRWDRANDGLWTRAASVPVDTAMLLQAGEPR